MNSRERILLGVLSVVVIFGGAGTLFYYFFLQDFMSAQAQLVADKKKLEEKRAEQKKAEAEQQAMLERDPRLKDWKLYSLPTQAPKDDGKAHTANEAESHLTSLQRGYHDYLKNLLLKHNFTITLLQAKAPDFKPVDSKGGAPSKDKIPVYTRLPFTVTGTASYKSMVDILREFYSDPLLQEVRAMTLAKPQTARPTGPGGPSDRNSKPIDVTMTIEVLMVTGAESRSTLMPKIENHGEDTALVLAPKRDYNLMADWDPFYGKPGGGGDRIMSPPVQSDLLEHVKLTMIAWNPDAGVDGRWYAWFYNQGTGDKEEFANLEIKPKFDIKDAVGDNAKTIFKGEIVFLDAKRVVFRDREKDKDKYYLMRVGDFLQPALKTPLTSKELKEFNLKLKDVAEAEKK